MTARSRRAFGGAVTILGFVCALLVPLAIVDMATQLPFMPEEWWQPLGEVARPPGQFDLRTMVICPGLVGWLGGWGYLLSIVWIPLAGFRAWRASRSGPVLRSHERVLLALVPTLIIVVELILHLTPLKYGYPLL
jgi:hypothetical protein